jgi:hypothetical protein
MRYTSALIVVIGVTATSCGLRTDPASEPAGGIAVSELPEGQIDVSVTEAHIRHLASDELAGRLPGTDGGMAAATYIASQFRSAGLSPLPGADGYFQHVPLIERAPVGDGFVLMGDDTLRMASDAVMVAGREAAMTADVVDVGYGTGIDLDSVGGRFEGKILIARTGSARGTSIRYARRLAATKRALAASRGAIGLLEIYSGSLPWTRVYDNLAPSAHMEDIGAPELTHLWIADPGQAVRRAAIDATLTVTIVTPESPHRRFTSPNVAGFIPGSDPVLRAEYVLLTAHYDHVGAGPSSDFPGRVPPASDEDDRIYNGARDNAIGVAALLNAASALAARPPSRSVLLVAVTAEESGLIGSSYYAKHPLIPLAQTVFVQNIDGAGYTDTSIVTVIGRGRTTADGDLDAGASAFGLEAISDPVPEQNLYERSDHIVFARLGIPAVAFSPGFRRFDRDLMQYYHRVNDEVDAHFGFRYVHSLAQAFAHAARRIADRTDRPAWVEGDPYDAVDGEP